MGRNASEVRVGLEKSMQTPTRLLPGEGRQAGKQSTRAPVWSAGVWDTARWKGDAGNEGDRPVGGRSFNVASGDGSDGSRTGPIPVEAG